MSTPDTNRKYIVTINEVATLEVPIRPSKRELGVVKVKARNIPDGKYNELEMVYAACLQMQEDAVQARDNELNKIKEAKKREPTAIEKLKVEKAHAGSIAAANQALAESKKDFIKWAICGWEPFSVDGGPTITFEGAQDEYEGESFKVASDSDIQNLDRAVLGYGMHRHILLGVMFEVLFDYQNGILTGAEELWKRNEAARAKAGNENPDTKAGKSEGDSTQEGGTSGNRDTAPLLPSEPQS